MNPTAIGFAESLLHVDDQQKVLRLIQMIRENRLDFVRAFIHMPNHALTHHRTLTLSSSIQERCIPLALEIVALDDFESRAYKIQSLFDSVKQGLVPVVEAMLATTPILEQERSYMLFDAAIDRNREMILDIVLSGPVSDYAFNLAVQKVAEVGDVPLLNILLDKHNLSRIARAQALVLATGNGHQEAMSLLLQSGQVHEDDLDWAIETAQSRGHDELCELINRHRQVRE